METGKCGEWSDDENRGEVDGRTVRREVRGWSVGEKRWWGGLEVEVREDSG